MGQKKIRRAIFIFSKNVFSHIKELVELAPEIEVQAPEPHPLIFKKFLKFQKWTNFHLLYLNLLIYGRNSTKTFRENSFIFGPSRIF